MFWYGFAIRGQNLPFPSVRSSPKLPIKFLRTCREQFPHFTETVVDHVMQLGYHFANEFEFGLNLILDGLERHRNER